MTTYKGNSGVVKIASNSIAELTSFSITETEGTTEDTALGDTARTFMADGLQAWSGQVSGHYYPGDTNGQALIVAGADLAWTFNFLGTGVGTQKLSGNAIVTQVQFGELQNGQVIPFSAQIQGNGALTRGTN